MPTNNDYLNDIASESRASGKTNNQLLKEIANNGGGSGGGAADKTYEVTEAQTGNFDIPEDATTVVYTNEQQVGITLPPPSKNRSIKLLYLYGDPTTLDGTFIPGIVVEPYSCYEVIAYQSDSETLSWVAISFGSIPLP